MKSALAIAAVGLALAVATPALATQITVGSADSGNCYPFMCNDSGTSSGQSIDYQQVYSAGAFGSNPFTIKSISFSYASLFGGTSSTLTGSYAIYLGYSTNPVNGLSTNLVSNVASQTLVGTYTGGGSANIKINVTPFVYNPLDGNLLLEVVATNQANVPNGSGNGYNWADYTGLVTSRAYCVTNVGCFASVGALVTTFNAVPEPGTLALLGAGLAGLGAVGRRRKAKQVA